MMSSQTGDRHVTPNLARLEVEYADGRKLTINEGDRDCVRKLAGAIAAAYGLDVREEGAPTGRRGGNLPSRDEMGRLTVRRRARADDAGRGDGRAEDVAAEEAGGQGDADVPDERDPAAGAGSRGAGADRGGDGVRDRWAGGGGGAGGGLQRLRGLGGDRGVARLHGGAGAVAGDELGGAGVG